MTIQGEKICPEETAQEKLGSARRAALHAYIVPTPLPFLHGSSQEARGPFWVPIHHGERAGGNTGPCMDKMWCVYIKQYCLGPISMSQGHSGPPTRWKVNFSECVKREPLGAPVLAPAPQACSSSPRSRACWGGPGRPQVWRRCSAKCFCSRCR